ncbi:MAG: hypothetical protein JNK81_11240 [Anaerolineales bacterium]|nr:hypothetical protein [Anaerolineales bacterium]
MKPKPSFEQYEQKLFLQAVGILIFGGIIVAILYRLTQNQSPFVLLISIAVWLTLSFIASSRLRRKDETVIAYKKRIKYIENNE